MIGDLLLKCETVLNVQVTFRQLLVLIKPGFKFLYNYAFEFFNAKPNKMDPHYAEQRYVKFKDGWIN